jgi:uncharacterized protein with PQ loop repeat
MTALMLLGIVSVAVPLSSTRGHWQGMAVHNSSGLDAGKGLALKMHQQQQQHLVSSESSSSGSSSSVPVSENSSGELSMSGGGITTDTLGGIVAGAAVGVARVGPWQDQVAEQQRQQQQQQQQQAGSGAATAAQHNPLKGWALTLVSEDVAYIVGTSFGYASSVLYLCSRVSQIHKNYSRKSAEGLALTMFMMAVCANLCTGCGILLRSFTWEQLKQQTPWVIGTLGTISLDMIILWQSQTYAKAKVVEGVDADVHEGRGDGGQNHHRHHHHHHGQQPSGVSADQQQQQLCGREGQLGDLRGPGIGAEGLHIRKAGGPAMRTGGDKRKEGDGEITAPLLLSSDVTLQVDG